MYKYVVVAYYIMHLLVVLDSKTDKAAQDFNKPGTFVLKGEHELYNETDKHDNTIQKEKDVLVRVGI